MQRDAADLESLLLVASDGRCFDAAKVGAALGLQLPTSVDHALQAASPALDDSLLKAWQAIDDRSYSGPGALSQPVHAPLFRHPGKIICVGLNFRGHAEEMRSPLPQWPVLFSKFDNALAGCGDTIQLPPPDVAHKFDYETELVIVVGSALRAGQAGDLLASVAGYCVGHDLSARDLQKERGGQWLLGKTLDGFAPIGPDFVGAALAGDPGAMAIETRRNGQVVQSSSTADFIFAVDEVLAYITRHFSLQPGDIVFTGTPQGVIAGKPAADQHWLRAGDTIESRVGNLGTLRFKLA